MVANEKDNGVVFQSCILQFLKAPADLVITELGPLQVIGPVA